MNLEKATFAGGCFWCMQPPYDKIPGVISTVVGYAGGTLKNPSYEAVSTGESGHVEAVQITFDKTKASYGQLLEIFWRSIDPTQAGGQFADIGSQYETAIFYQNEEQKKAALASKESLQKSKKFDKIIAVKIKPAGEFYPAEDGHQKYYKKNPEHYEAYKAGSGRKRFLEKTWGQPQPEPPAELKK